MRKSQKEVGFFPMLKVKNIEVLYAKVIRVLKGISFEVPDKAIVTLLGANGAGKTTCLKAICGLLKTEDGEVSRGIIEFDGKMIQNGNPKDIARLGISLVMEGRRIFEHLTVQENLFIGAHVCNNRDETKRNLDIVYEYFPRLKDLRDKISGYLSGGEQQMLVIGSGLMSSPTLMLLDEPSLGLSPLMVMEIFAILKRVNEEQNNTIMLVEQNARASLGIAHWGYVIEDGRVVLEGLSEKLRANEDIREFYLGLSKLGEKKSYRTVKHYKRRKRWLG
jgi:branched-chain amino acid transport system ATP-binding protein